MNLRLRLLRMAFSRSPESGVKKLVSDRLTSGFEEAAKRFRELGPMGPMTTVPLKMFSGLGAGVGNGLALGQPAKQAQEAIDALDGKTITVDINRRKPSSD